VQAYGTRIDHVLGDAKSKGDLGGHFGTGLTEAEVHYLMQHEWAENADDVLWRRSKLGLYLSAQEKEALGQFMMAGQKPAAARL
jgi:glycerol-3-phosphate dehydrogenase